MKVDIDLKAGFLQNLKREVLAQLTPEERAVIEVSTGEMGNKPDAVKLGWLKMRTKEPWTKQGYTRALEAIALASTLTARRNGGPPLPGRGEALKKQPDEVQTATARCGRRGACRLRGCDVRPGRNGSWRR